MMKQTRGERNRNPLNIRKNVMNPWQGEIPGIGEKEFCVFSDRKYAYRAAFRILKSYRKRGITTMRKIIQTWAPPKENNTEAYIKNVQRLSGLEPDREIRENDRESLTMLVKAMARIESRIDEDMHVIYVGYALANIGSAVSEK